MRSLTRSTSECERRERKLSQDGSCQGGCYVSASISKSISVMRRWVVERTFAWLSTWRRLSKGVTSQLPKCRLLILLHGPCLFSCFVKEFPTINRGTTCCTGQRGLGPSCILRIEHTQKGLNDLRIILTTPPNMGFQELPR